MHHVCKPKRMLTGLLAVVLAGFVVQSAAASRVLQDQSSAAKTPLVIPYLSHGIGVDQSQYSGQSSSSTPLVIPYLSHGVGVDQSLYSGTAKQAPDAFERAVTRHEAFVNGMNATAASSGPDAFQRAVNRSQATQSTAVRPDDRWGLRGIGTISGAQSTSTAGTNWNTVFMVGGALLGILLIVAAAVVLSRRQQGRVLAH